MKQKNKRRPASTIGFISLHIVKRYFPQVTKVVDADKPAIIEVTSKHVTNAKVLSHRTCALALACQEFFHCDGVVIALTTSWVVYGKTAVRYHNADTISREITSFDRKAGFDVGFYILTPASPSSRLGRKHTAPTWKGDKSKSKPRQFRHFTRNVRTTVGFYPKTNE